jgi:hypothetical protein
MKVVYLVLSALATMTIAAPNPIMEDGTVGDTVEKRDICGPCQNGRRYFYNCMNGGCTSRYENCWNAF